MKKMRRRNPLLLLHLRVVRAQVAEPKKLCMKVGALFASSVAGANVAKDAVCLTTESYTSPTGTMVIKTY